MPISATRPVNLNESNNKKGNTYKSFQLAGKNFFVRETIVCSLLVAYVGCLCASNNQKLRIAGDNDQRSKRFQRFA